MKMPPDFKHQDLTYYASDNNCCSRLKVRLFQTTATIPTKTLVIAVAAKTPM
jgi:hypothetical protein